MKTSGGAHNSAEGEYYATRLKEPGAGKDPNFWCRAQIMGLREVSLRPYFFEGVG